MGDNSPQTSPNWSFGLSHRMQVFTKGCSMCLPWGAVCQEQTAPAQDSHRVTSPTNKLALAWTPLSMDPQILPRTCFSVKSQPPLDASNCTGVGAAGRSLLPRGPSWAAGASQLWCLEHLLCLLLHWCGVLQGCFSEILLLISLDEPSVLSLSFSTPFWKRFLQSFINKLCFWSLLDLTDLINIGFHYVNSQEQ